MHTVHIDTSALVPSLLNPGNCVVKNARNVFCYVVFQVIALVLDAIVRVVVFRVVRRAIYNMRDSVAS